MSLRLLDIHISEMHDAFFKVLSKKKPMYTCLVDGCEEKFMHDEKRNRHLVQVQSLGGCEVVVLAILQTFKSALDSCVSGPPIPRGVFVPSPPARSEQGYEFQAS